MNPEIHLCRKCQNWLTFDDIVIECDYEIFAPTKKDDADIFVAEQFDCPLWSLHKSLESE